MGERTPPKTRGFWISFWSISMRWKKVPQGIGHGPTLAAADVAGREHWQFYRFKRLSNRALAANGGMYRCRKFGRPARLRVVRGSGSGSYRRVPEPVIACHPRGAWERQRGWGYKRFVVRRSAYILVFAGYTAAFHDTVSRAGSLETCGFKQTFWSLLGLRPKVTRARGRGILFAGGMKGTSNGPSGTPAPTGCVYPGAPIFGKPPTWTQQSHCTITDQRAAARCVGAAAGIGAEAIPYGPFCVVSRSA